jgi:FMN phosphatase YigB (HAD superfamily)
MARIAAVIVDLGNVLAFHDNALLYRRLAERAGTTPEAVARALAAPALWRPLNCGPLDEAGVRQAVCDALGLDLDGEAFTALWCCHFTINDAVLPLIEGLVGRVRLVLLSNTNAVHTAYLRPRLPVLERFDHLLFSHEVGLAKPDPAFFREALTRAGVGPEQAAFFDDVPDFVAAARALGIHGRVFRDVATFRDDLRALGLAP